MPAGYRWIGGWGWWAYVLSSTKGKREKRFYEESSLQNTCSKGMGLVLTSSASWWFILLAEGLLEDAVNRTRHCPISRYMVTKQLQMGISAPKLIETLFNTMNQSPAQNEPGIMGATHALWCSFMEHYVSSIPLTKHLAGRKSSSISKQKEKKHFPSHLSGSPN